jgi:hypothetical protein
VLIAWLLGPLLLLLWQGEVELQSVLLVSLPPMVLGLLDVYMDWRRGRCSCNNEQRRPAGPTGQI